MKKIKKDIIIYQTSSWATAKHIRNIIKDCELLENQVCAKFAHTAEDGKVYNVKYFRSGRTPLTRRFCRD